MNCHYKNSSRDCWVSDCDVSSFNCSLPFSISGGCRDRMCLSRSRLRTSILSHRRHRYGESPSECRRMCLLRLLGSPNAREQILHRSGFCPVCVRRWIVSPYFREYCFPQNEHRVANVRPFPLSFVISGGRGFVVNGRDYVIFGRGFGKRFFVDFSFLEMIWRDVNVVAWFEDFIFHFYVSIIVTWLPKVHLILSAFSQFCILPIRYWLSLHSQHDFQFCIDE